MRKLWSSTRCLLLALAFASSVSSAQAFSCFTLGRAVDESAYFLTQASNAGNPATAQASLSKAYPMLMDAAAAALDCDCEDANNGFAAAAEAARDAVNADGSGSMGRLMSRAVKRYNAGVKEIELCAGEHTGQSGGLR